MLAWEPIINAAQYRWGSKYLLQKNRMQDFTECLKLLHDLEFLILAFRPFQIVAPRYERQF